MAGAVSLCCALMAVFIKCGAAADQPGEGMTLSQFRMRQTDASGHPEWQLEGREAEVNEIMVDMKDVKLHVYRPNKADLYITSPACRYNRTTKVISGAGKVHAETKGLVVDGRGYRMLAEQRRLFIDHDVRMVINSAESRLQEDFMPEPEDANENRDRNETKKSKKSDQGDLQKCDLGE